MNHICCICRNPATQEIRDIDAYPDHELGYWNYKHREPRHVCEKHKQTHTFFHMEENGPVVAVDEAPINLTNEQCKKMHSFKLRRNIEGAGEWEVKLDGKDIAVFSVEIKLAVGELPSVKIEVPASDIYFETDQCAAEVARSIFSETVKDN